MLGLVGLMLLTMIFAICFFLYKMAWIFGVPVVLFSVVGAFAIVLFDYICDNK